MYCVCPLYIKLQKNKMIASGVFPKKIPRMFHTTHFVQLVKFDQLLKHLC